MVGRFLQTAFSTQLVPGQLEEKPFVDGVLVPILGSASSPEAPKLRCLLYEAFTATACDLKQRTDRTGDALPTAHSPLIVRRWPPGCLGSA
eukprot:3026733-Amphidinium_carterae.1